MRIHHPWLADLCANSDSHFSKPSPLLPIANLTPHENSAAKIIQARRNQRPPCGVEPAKQTKNETKGLTMLISTLALAMSIAMMVSAIVILYNETVARKQKSSFE